MKRRTGETGEVETSSVGRGLSTLVPIGISADVTKAVERLSAQLARLARAYAAEWRRARARAKNKT